MPPDTQSVGRAGVRSVRLRTTLAAVVVVAVATSAGALLLLRVLGDLLTEELVAATTTRAVQIASTMSLNGPGSVLAMGDFENDVAQVVRPDGTVAASSPNAAGLPPVVWPPPSGPVEIIGPVDEEPLIAIGHEVLARDDRLVLLVARTVESRDDAVRFVAELLWIGLPVLLLIVGALTWTWSAGRCDRWRPSGEKWTRFPRARCTVACQNHRVTTRSPGCRAQ